MMSIIWNLGHGSRRSDDEAPPSPALHLCVYYSRNRPRRPTMGATATNLVYLRVAVRPTAFIAGPQASAVVNPVLEFTVGDLTHEGSDAIVNPAGAGRVDLAIRRAAGPELLEAFHRSASVLPQGK